MNTGGMQSGGHGFQEQKCKLEMASSAPEQFQNKGVPALAQQQQWFGGLIAQLVQSSQQIAPGLQPSSSNAGGQILEPTSDLDKGKSSADSVVGSRFGGI